MLSAFEGTLRPRINQNCKDKTFFCFYLFVLYIVFVDAYLWLMCIL